MRKRYFDRNGNLISGRQWSQLGADDSYRILTDTHLPNGYQVITLWLGIDHGQGNNDFLFETAVFDHPFRATYPEEFKRYSREADAITGHSVMVSRWETKAPLPRVLKKP